MDDRCSCGAHLPCLACALMAEEERFRHYEDRHQEAEDRQKGSIWKYPANDPLNGGKNGGKK